MNRNEIPCKKVIANHFRPFFSLVVKVLLVRALHSAILQHRRSAYPPAPTQRYPPAPTYYTALPASTDAAHTLQHRHSPRCGHAWFTSYDFPHQPTLPSFRRTNSYIQNSDLIARYSKCNFYPKPEFFQQLSSTLTSKPQPRLTVIADARTTWRPRRRLRSKLTTRCRRLKEDELASETRCGARRTQTRSWRIRQFEGCGT